MIRSGLSPSKTDRQAGVLGTDEPVGVDLDVVEEQLPLPVGVARRGRDRLALEARRVAVDDEQRQQAAAALLVACRCAPRPAARAASSTPEMNVFVPRST